MELVRSERACDFRVRYISVIGTGTASFVTNPAEKSRIFDRFMEKCAEVPPETDEATLR